jgi:DNA-binding NarL/FixJ family response regulator
MIRLCVADPRRVVVEALTFWLHQDGFCTVVGTASRAESLDAVLVQTPPDLLLLSQQLVPDPLALASRLQRQHARLPIILWGSDSRPERLSGPVYRSTLAGYLTASTSLDELRQALQRACRGERVFSADVLLTLLRYPRTPLTPLESAILGKLREGKKRAAICAELEIRSTNTYDTHVQHLKEKLGAHSTNELLRVATEQGFF